MEYKEKYEQALNNFKKIKAANKDNEELVDFIEYEYPELKENKDDEKHNGGIVSEDFNEGEGFYKVNLAYLNKEQVKEIEGLVKKWNPEIKESEDERIRKELIEFVNQYGDKFYGQIAKASAIFWLEKQGEQKPADNVEPKFKVKYGGGEYNVLEVRDIAGVTFYGIEDEPNHIDYVKAENCKIIGSYVIKENGSLYPTKIAVFSEHKPALNEDDKQRIEGIIATLMGCVTRLSNYGNLVTGDIIASLKDDIDWLKSIKEKMKGE